MLPRHVRLAAIARPIFLASLNQPALPPCLLARCPAVHSTQRYDDLGEGRPALGLASGDAAEEVEESFPYPRHIANNGTPFEGPGKQWLPLDERFDDSKTRGFNGNLLGGILPAFNTVLPRVSLPAADLLQQAEG